MLLPLLLSLFLFVILAAFLFGVALTVLAFLVAEASGGLLNLVGQKKTPCFLFPMAFGAHPRGPPEPRLTPRQVKEVLQLSAVARRSCDAFHENGLRRTEGKVDVLTCSATESIYKLYYAYIYLYPSKIQQSNVLKKCGSPSIKNAPHHMPECLRALSLSQATAGCSAWHWPWQEHRPCSAGSFQSQ